jgi:predicted CXXCH cytochrome family protein
MGRFRVAAVLAGAVAVLTVLPSDRGWSAATAAIVYPPDRALLTGDGSLELLGFSAAAAPGTLTITGKGGSRPLTVGKGAFTAKVQLDPGMNVLDLEGQKSTVFLAVGDSPTVPPGYSAPDTHAVDNGCDECHVFAGDAVKLLEPPPRLCARCHDDVLKGKNGKPQAVLHPPAEEGDCLACHGFHRLSLKGLPAGAKRDLCFGCHDDFTGGGKKRMHAPVAKGECTGCHEAHGSSGKKLLPATGVKLCLLCHADPSHRKEGGDWKVTHPALDDGCPSCHLPHVSDNPGLLKKPQTQVCGECHDPFPVTEGGKDLVIHNPVEEGECSGCHAVHGSDVRKLLAADGKGLCVKCHNDPSTAAGGAAWATPHPALDDGCFSCHAPHVAPAAGMLKKDQAPLCLDCHEAFKVPEGGSAHKPVTEGQCARCHAPHGSAFAKLLQTPPGKQLCLKCHKDPSLSPGGAEWAQPHPALDDGCPACHAPHVAPAPRLLSKEQPALCAGCHEDKNLNPEGGEWATPHPPVKGGLCGACHGVHGAPEKALLKRSPMDLCTASCHTEVHENHRRTELDPATNQPKKQLVGLPTVFPVRRQDGVFACVGCHLPHGSDNPRMWNRPEQDFCTQCHKF